jgi:hypothetical protein
MTKTLRNIFFGKTLRKFFNNKKGVSVALTTMIITAGVIASGIAVLYWGYAWGNIARDQYSQSISQSQDAVGERLSFEYISYLNNQLTVNVINSGQTGDLQIARVNILDSEHNIVSTIDNASLMEITTNLPITDSNNHNGLDAGKEGYFTINAALSSGYYTFNVVSERGRNYYGTFSTA